MLHVSDPGMVPVTYDALMSERMKEGENRWAKASSGSGDLGGPHLTTSTSHDAFSSECVSFLTAELTWKCFSRLQIWLVIYGRPVREQGRPVRQDHGTRSWVTSPRTPVISEPAWKSGGSPLPWHFFQRFSKMRFVKLLAHGPKRYFAWLFICLGVGPQHFIWFPKWAHDPKMFKNWCSPIWFWPGVKKPLSQDYIVFPYSWNHVIQINRAGGLFAF